MVFYLGNKVEGLVADKVRNLRNKTKSWTYGYNETIDTVIISKDGTLGEIYCIEGINIGLPQKPDDSEIINYGKTSKKPKMGKQNFPMD
jgi:hypothetical protein